MTIQEKAELLQLELLTFSLGSMKAQLRVSEEAIIYILGRCGNPELLTPPKEVEFLTQPKNDQS